MGDQLPYWDSMDEFFDHLTPAIGMTWEEMKKKAPFEYMSKEEWKSYYVYKQIDDATGLPKGFDTPSKKIEVYVESMITLGRTGQPFLPVEFEPADKDYEPLPYYLEPVESPVRDDDTAREYPLVMTNGRVPFYHHSTRVMRLLCVNCIRFLRSGSIRMWQKRMVSHRETGYG